MIEHLQKLDTQIIENFLESRKSPELFGIPKALGDYILQLNDASNLFRKYRSVTECARKLQKLYPEISIHTCKQRIYDSINYFNSDCSVTSEAWNLYFADQMEKLAEVNLVAHDIKEARVCFERAREYRIAASSHAIDPDRIKFKPQLVSADMQLDRMGVKPEGLMNAWNEAIKIIDSRESLGDNDKKRIKTETMRELNIKAEDTDYENS